MPRARLWNPALDRRCAALTYSRQSLERLAGVDRNRRVAGLRPRIGVSITSCIERGRVEHHWLMSGCADLVGGYEGRSRAEEWVDDDVAAIGEVEDRSRLGGRGVLKAAAGGPRPDFWPEGLSRQRAEPSPTLRLS